MKRILFFSLVTSLFFVSCSDDDEPTPLAADFTATVTGESPNAQITIVNKSTGAKTYSWTFGEGASMESSTKETPDAVQVDKAGEITITLVAGNGTDEKEVTKTVSINGHSGVATFTDVEFGLAAGDGTYGRLFSFATGEIYKDSELNATIGSTIHLAFGSMGGTMYYFESPTVADYNVEGASATKVINWESTPTISVEEFDAMNDDADLSGLTITGTEDSFGNSSIPGTVLFEIADGRKGVIKTKSVNSERLLVDIKIQKY